MTDILVKVPPIPGGGPSLSLTDTSAPGVYHVECELGGTTVTFEGKLDDLHVQFSELASMLEAFIFRPRSRLTASDKRSNLCAPDCTVYTPQGCDGRGGHDR